MAGIKFKKDKNWAAFAKALDSKRWAKLAQGNVNRANGRIAFRIRAISRRLIQTKAFDQNAALTVAVKGSSTPLVDTGQGLWGALTIVQPTWDKAFVGVLKSDGKYSIAKALHDGTKIKVTERMRAMFYYLWLKSMGRNVELTGRALELWERRSTGWKPLKRDTQAISIPERPYILSAFQDPKLRAYAQRQWRDAVNKTCKEAMGQ